MTNFADLVALLQQEEAIVCCPGEELAAAIHQALDGSVATTNRTERAYNALSVHSGATRRSVALVEEFYQS